MSFFGLMFHDILRIKQLVKIVLPIKKNSAHPLDGARGIMFSGCPSMRTCVLVGGIPDWLAIDFFIVFYSL